MSLLTFDQLSGVVMTDLDDDDGLPVMSPLVFWPLAAVSAALWAAVLWLVFWR